MQSSEQLVNTQHAGGFRLVFCSSDLKKKREEKSQTGRQTEKH